LQDGVREGGPQEREEEARNGIGEVQTGVSKKLDKVSAELADSELMVLRKSEEIQTLASNYDDVMTNLAVAHTETTRVKAERSSVKADYDLPKKEFQACQSSILSSRTTHGVENDRVQKAVHKPVARRDGQLEALKKKVADLEKCRLNDQRIIQELSADRLTLKELNIEKEEKPTKLTAVQVALEKELAFERLQKNGLEEKLLGYQK